VAGPHRSPVGSALVHTERRDQALGLNDVAWIAHTVTRVAAGRAVSDRVPTSGVSAEKQRTAGEESFLPRDRFY
jgi:hypothetical protein